MKSAIGLMVFLSATGTLGWMLLLPSALRVEVESRTGFPVEIGSLASNPLGFSLSGKDVVVGNPSAYGGGEPMLQITELKADASLPSLGRGEIWIDDMELRVATARIVADERGKLNVDSFLRSLFASENGDGSMPFHATRVHLIVDEVQYVDLSAKIAGKRSIRPMLDVEVHDTDKPTELLGPIIDLGKRLGALPVGAGSSSPLLGDRL